MTYTRQDIMEREYGNEEINKIYHNIIAEEYDKNHNFRKTESIKVWEITKGLIKKNKKRLKILDIGTGTGFVPLAIGSSLKKNDKFYCLDLSKEMLKIAREKILSKGFNCKFEFIEGGIESINDNDFNIITINSTLHHISDLNRFLNIADLILKEKGLIVIGHEPNELFNLNRKLKGLSIKYKRKRYPKRYIWNISRNYRLNGILEKVYSFFNKEYYNKREIEKETKQKVIRELPEYRGMNLKEIEKIIELRMSKGINPFKIFPKYKRIYFRTYNHLSEDSSEDIRAKEENMKLAKIYPNDGATFSMIIKKEKLK